MTPLDALADVGLTVHDERVAPRPGAWAPVAVMWHHVGDAPPAALKVPPPALKLVQEGRSDLPGPVCQWLVDGEGGWWWITDGLANHGGKGDRDVFAWLASSDPRPDDPPRPNGDDSSVMNRYTVGVEVEGNGNWSAKVHASMLAGTRALLAYYGARADNLIAHKESTTRKIDPTGIDMAAARRWLRTPQEDDMTADEHAALIYARDQAEAARYQSQENAKALARIEAALAAGAGGTAPSVEAIADELADRLDD